MLCASFYRAEASRPVEAPGLTAGARGPTCWSLNPVYQTFCLENVPLPFTTSQYGMPTLVAIDTTHRLIVEGYNVMPVGTVSVDQKFHIIGYGICDKEDQEAHDFVVSALFAEVHRVVRARALAKIQC